VADAKLLGDAMDSPIDGIWKMRGLEPLFRPLEDFTELHAVTARRFGRHLIDLSFPNPRVPRDIRGAEMLSATASAIGITELQYSPIGGLTLVRRKVAAALSAATGLPYGYLDVVLTPGATAALAASFFALLEPGDEVIIVTPAWMDYPLYLKNACINWRFVRGEEGRLDVAAVVDSWGPDTRAVVLSQPNCPTGVVIGDSQFRELADGLHSVRADGGGLPVLFSDETHRDQVWSGPFSSPARFYDQVVSYYSLGKAWSLQGQRAGYLAVSPRFQPRQTAQRDLVRALRVSGGCAPTVLMQQVMGELAALRPDTATLAADQVRVRALLHAAGAAVVDATATAFVYVRCPEGLTSGEFVRQAADRGVLVLPAELFHDSFHYRIALNVTGERLGEGIRRLTELHETAGSRVTTAGDRYE
jgi:aspartate aminotransferase